MTLRPQRIVCAAIRFETNISHSTFIVCGIRHYDRLMNNNLNMMPRVVGVETQGFVDNRGEFLTRTEAWVVAEKADQIVRRVGGDDADGGTLYSENLY